MFEVNYFAIFVATVVSMVLGLVWYSVLFRRQWMALVGIDSSDKGKMEQMKKDAGLNYGLTVVGAFVTAYVFALLFLWIGVEDVPSGMVIAALIWAGFIAGTTFTTALFEKKSKKLWAINEGYHLVALLFTSAVLILLK